jgi:hypothetical protein
MNDCSDSYAGIWLQIDYITPCIYSSATSGALPGSIKVAQYGSIIMFPIWETFIQIVSYF